MPTSKSSPVSKWQSSQTFYNKHHVIIVLGLTLFSLKELDGQPTYEMQFWAAQNNDKERMYMKHSS